jgi:uncharacterized protein YcfL
MTRISGNVKPVGALEQPGLGRRSRVIGILQIALVTVLAGCKADTGPIGPISDEALTYPQLTLSDRSLQKKVGFQKPVVSQTGDGLLHVTVPLRARTDEPVLLEYKPVWLDKSGRPVPPELSWRHMRLEPRQPANIVVNATSKEATDFNIQFRPARY